VAIAASSTEGQSHDAGFFLVFHRRAPALADLGQKTVEIAGELRRKAGASAKLAHLFDDGAKRRRVDLLGHRADEFPVALFCEIDPPVLRGRRGGGRCRVIGGEDTGDGARAEPGGAGVFKEIATLHEVEASGEGRLR